MSLKNTKNFNVGILAEDFVKWGGGVDFLRMLIRGFSHLSKKSDVDINIFILIPVKQRLKFAVNNLIKQFLNLFFANKFQVSKSINISQIEGIFKSENENVRFCKYLDLKHTIKYNKIDIVLPTFHPFPQNFPIPWVGYIYDFQHKYYPEFFSKEEILIRDKNFHLLLENSKLVIVNAQAVKADIEKFYGKLECKVISLPFCPVLNLDLIKSDTSIGQYCLPSQYFIISNQFWKHKDHVTAIKGFKIFLSNFFDKKVGLVMTGQTHDDRFPEYFDEIKNLISELDVRSNIYILGYIPKNEQLQILRESIAVIQPTLFEGGPGGGSIYESIAYGVPSIVSDIPVNMELEDESVTFFKNGSPEDLAEKMHLVISKSRIIYSNSDLVEKNNIQLDRLGKTLKDIIHFDNIIK